MEFEWDEGKRESNWQKHNVDFAAIPPIFDNETVKWIDDRKSYGEERVNLLGTIKGEIFHITYTKRNSKYRLISARRANSRERRKYYKGIVGRI